MSSGNEVDLSELFTVIKVYDNSYKRWLSENISIENIWSVIITNDGLRVMTGFWPIPRIGYLVTLESWTQKHKHWEWPYSKLEDFTKEKNNFKLFA